MPGGLGMAASESRRSSGRSVGRVSAPSRGQPGRHRQRDVCGRASRCPDPIQTRVGQGDPPPSMIDEPESALPVQRGTSFWRVAVARPDLGTKRICPVTGKKFYDLNKTPVISPYSGEVVPTSVSPSSARAAAPVVARKETPVDDEEETDGPELVSLDEAEAEEADKDTDTESDDTLDIEDDGDTVEDDTLVVDEDDEDTSDLIEVNDDEDDQ